MDTPLIWYSQVAWLLPFFGTLYRSGYLTEGGALAFDGYSSRMVLSLRLITHYPWCSRVAWFLIFSGALTIYGYFSNMVLSSFMVNQQWWCSPPDWLLTSNGTLLVSGYSGNMVLSL
jgi:hypothetical protein